MDELPDDDEEYSRVVSIRTGSRARTVTAGRGRPEPWTPREPTAAAVVRPSLPPPLSEPRLTRTHRWMIGAFVIICVGMIVGMVMVRIWDEAARTLAAIPTDPDAIRTDVTVPAAQTTVPQPAGPPGAAGTPAISTEIHVLQPNYTVVPGDTLGTIARKNGTTVEALASINNLENRNSLSIGQKLIIP
jgi:hypothetical protein